MQQILISLAQYYQRHRPARFYNLCIYEPSCSEYMILALRKYGGWKGLSMGLKRIRRCDGHHDGGIDLP